MSTEVHTKGHFSAKLVIRNEEENTETWLDYDTREHEEDPEVGIIHVFNSELGVYEACSSLAEAKAKFEEHTQRLTHVISDDVDVLRAKREELEIQNKHLRNINPFIIGPAVKNDPA